MLAQQIWQLRELESFSKSVRKGKSVTKIICFQITLNGVLKIISADTKANIKQQRSKRSRVCNCL